MRTTFRMAVIAIIHVLPVSMPSALADVYRCVRPGRVVSFQQIPCNGDSEPLEIRDRRSGWSALRPGEKALLQRYRHKDAAHSHRARSARNRPARDEPACRRRRNQLDEVRARLRRGYRLKEGEALHRKRESHEEYLRRFCS